MSLYRRVGLLIVSVAVLLGALTACDENSSPSAQEQQTTVRDNAYETLVGNHPVRQPGYSGDLVNLDFWVETWGMESRLAYVYLLASDGTFIGYYVLDGLPTAKCKMATPTWDFERVKGVGGNLDQIVPAPGLTGTYSSGSGECHTYYGRDATSGSYVEWTAGMGISQLVFGQPMSLPEGVEPPPLGFTELGDELV